MDKKEQKVSSLNISALMEIGKALAACGAELCRIAEQEAKIWDTEFEQGCPDPTPEEQPKHAGAHMGAGNGFMLTDDDAVIRGDLPHLFSQRRRVLRTIPVGDINALEGDICSLLRVFPREGLNGSFAPPHLVTGDDPSGGVPVQDRLDAQHRGDAGRDAAHPAGPL